MTVKVKKNKLISGSIVEIQTYLPESELLTTEKREQADKLDDLLRKSLEEINKEYLIKSKDLQTSLKKWYWLGEKIDYLVKNLPFEQKDIDGHLIWLAINQYLSDSLKREDVKRSGTSKDHLNKCWLLYKTKHRSWIKTWAGWDAITDRGDQLLDERLLLELEQCFNVELSNKDYQFIFKEITQLIPSQIKRKEIELMSVKNLRDIVVEVKKRFDSRNYNTKNVE